MRIILLGAAGSGKGTQGAALSEIFGVPHISSGDLLRQHIDAGNDLGREAQKYVGDGNLVPDDLVLDVVREAVRDAAVSGGYILDGYPRTLAQAERAYELAAAAGVAADAAVYLEVADDVARERLLGRVGEGRTDDVDPVAINRRLQLFHEETQPLLAFYADRGILVTIDAMQSPEAVTRAILDAVAQLHRSQ